MAKQDRNSDPGRTPPGPGVDLSGAPVDDPTRSVRELVNAAIERQDDLRAAEAAHSREVGDLRVAAAAAEARSMRYVERMRADHAKDLRKAEKGRLDAIRQVDQQALQQAAAVQDSRATALATQVAAAAEAMRSQVAATADAAATALATALAPILARIEQLSQAMFETAGGKKEVVETQARGANSGLWWAVGIGCVGLLFSALMFVVATITLAAILTHGFTQ